MEPFLGEIRLFPYGFTPRGWASCNGQILAIATNQALFSLLGTTYGGNGVTTFALPDLRGRVATHAEFGLGESGGQESVTLTPSSMPQHSHQIRAVASATSPSPTGNMPANPTFALYDKANPNTTLDASSLQNAGGSQPHENMQPYLVLNYCIATAGQFPPHP